MKKSLLVLSLLFLAGCSSLPKGVHDVEPKTKSNVIITKKIVANQRNPVPGENGSLYGVYDVKNQRWVHELKYKNAKKFRHGNLHPLRFGYMEAYALQNSDNTWVLATHAGRFPINDKLTRFECDQKTVCVGHDQAGIEYRYLVKEKFKLISKGNYQWEKTSEGFYRTAGKQKGLYFYRFGEQFKNPAQNHIGSILNYDLGRGNQKSTKYLPVMINIYEVNGERRYGLARGDYAGPICKNIELEVFLQQPQDGQAKRANFICSHVDGHYVSFAKFRTWAGGPGFLENGSVKSWFTSSSKTDVIQKSKNQWDEAIAADLANVQKDIEKDKKFKAYVAAKQARMNAYAKELVSKGVRTRYTTIAGWCRAKNLDRFECSDAYKAAETYYNWSKNQNTNSWKDIDRTVTSSRSGSRGTTSGFDSGAAAYARQQDMKRFQQSMDYISGKSTYNPDEVYRQNR